MIPAWLKKPKTKRALLALIDEEIRQVVARRSAYEAEQRFLTEQGERASFDDEKRRCADDILHWFDQWVWTYDPRLAGTHDPATGHRRDGYVPFRLFPRQVELAQWVEARIDNQQEGAVDKSRDIGFTYLVAGICLHRWLFTPGFKATFGSREADLVDVLDDPDSIFEKIRIILRRLPLWMLPKGFNWTKHSNVMRLANPETGAMIAGEAGDDMGRGGRSTVFVVDEAAFVRHTNKVARAISGNADCILWASSSNGMGTFFYRKKRSLPPGQVFRFHYGSDPRKTADWVAAKRANMEPADWAAEYEIDDTASLEGVCIPAAWVLSAQSLSALEPDMVRANMGITGGDVGAGKARSVVIHRFGPVILPPASRTDPDTTDTAYWMLEQCDAAGSKVLNFDEPGVGKGVLSTLTKTAEPGPDADARPGKTVIRVPVNTGDSPTTRQWPDGKTSAQKFGNLKAELWWLARQAFQRTHEHVQAVRSEGKEGHRYPLDELIALPSGNPEADKLAQELSVVRHFRNDKGKIVIERKDQLAKRGVPSPDYADALVLAFLEAPDDAMSRVVIDADEFHRENPFSFKTAGGDGGFVGFGSNE